jgi:hypothetical protein
MALMVEGSTGISSLFGQIAPEHGSWHCRWWMEPWTSSTFASSKPAFWNWPSTFEVTTKYSMPKRSIHRRSI